MRGRKRPEPLRLFLDRSIGKHDLALRLRAAGAEVEVHDDHLPRDAPDEEWLALSGKRGWAALTIDRLRERPNEREAILVHRARVIIVRTGRVSGIELGDSIARRLGVVSAFCGAHPAPFLAVLSRSGLRSVRLPNAGKEHRG